MDKIKAARGYSMSKHKSGSIHLHPVIGSSAFKQMLVSMCGISPHSHESFIDECSSGVVCKKCIKHSDCFMFTEPSCENCAGIDGRCVGCLGSAAAQNNYSNYSNQRETTDELE